MRCRLCNTGRILARQGAQTYNDGLDCICIIAIKRTGLHYTEKQIHDVKLRVGDILLVWCHADKLETLRGGANFIIAEDVHHEIIQKRKAWKAVLLFPIAISTAMGIGVDPRPFVMAVCFGASACFATPIGYQTNLLVYGPGGYRFSDYLKLGIPLNLLVLILGSGFIPIIWSF